jgi:hypothetical protein
LARFIATDYSEDAGSMSEFIGYLELINAFIICVLLVKKQHIWEWFSGYFSIKGTKGNRLTIIAVIPVFKTS